ncbi:MAG: hypothetical protein ACRELB_23355 [Polyangiaceae bacterium]
MEKSPAIPHRHPTTTLFTTCVGSRVVTSRVPPSPGDSEGTTSMPGCDGYPASTPRASSMRTVTRGGRLRSAFSPGSNVSSFTNASRAASSWFRMAWARPSTW